MTTPDARDGLIPIVKSGLWLYDGVVDMPVDIVGLTYDFWFELGKEDDQLEPGETPQVPGESGLLYYVRYSRAGEISTTTWPDSLGHRTVDAAMRAAQERLPSVIRWA